MICAIMQPTYIPWIGYFDMMDKVDTFVFYDDVQLSKRSWQVRNRIKGINGEIWLTIPVRKNTDRENTFINQAKINSSEKWLTKHFVVDHGQQALIRWHLKNHRYDFDCRQL